jgi:hypothetical protein
MNRAELVQECIDRGYDYAKTSRIQGFVQRAYEEICSRYPWSFLEKDASGEAPLVIADVRQVLYVIDTTRKARLQGTDNRWLSNYYPDLATATGLPAYWYLDGTTLLTYPTGTTQLSVRYIQTPETLADGDEPLIPAEWHYLIVDRAIVDCLKDDDEYEEARALLGDVEVGVRKMVPALRRNLQNNRSILTSGYVGDYL